MELSSTAKVILGMVAAGRTTGYDIKQLVDKSTRNFWAASYGQIYPELKRLEDAGLLSGSDDPTGGRARRSYRLTKAGERALREWLTNHDEMVYELRDEGMLKLFFADLLKPEEAKGIARAKREFHEQIAARLREIEPAARASGAVHPVRVLQYGIGLNEWAAEQMKDLEE
jgi:DNA-binding PadR family transcriptional regulator